MKKLVRMPVVLIVVITTSTLINIDAKAQADEGSIILSTMEFTVKPGHNRQFRNGIEAWKKCYLENEGEWRWNLWQRVQGTGNVYVLSSVMGSWAEMDDGPDPAARECRDIVRDLINPNIENGTRNLARLMADRSIPFAQTEPNDVVWVTFWRVNNFLKFNETVRTVTSTIKDVEGEYRSFWYRSMGGDRGSAHFFAVIPYENFTALDNPRDGVWTVVENAHGEEKRDELQKSYRETVDESWAYLFRRVPDLSRGAAE
jgi:hypothetical protein